MKSDEKVQLARADRASGNARIPLIAGLSLLLIAVIGATIFGLPWLAAIAAVAAVIVAGFLFDMSRSKNAAWHRLSEQYGAAFAATHEGKNFGTGRGQLGGHNYFGIRCFASPDGLEIGRILSALNPPIFVPWGEIAKVDAFPNLLTGRQGFETDMQAQIVLRDQPDLAIEVPWLTEFRELLPKSVRFRSIKLSKK